MAWVNNTIPLDKRDPDSEFGVKAYRNILLLPHIPGRLFTPGYPIRSRGCRAVRC
jgi:hypothetical protein